MIPLPAWAHTVISSRAGMEEFPLAFAGELAGHRVVCFAFDLAGRSLRKGENLSLLLLVLNAVRWLTPPDPAWPVQVDVGDRYRETLPQPMPLSITSPDGAVASRDAVREVAIEIERRGEYRIRVGDAERTVFANLFDPEESDVGREGASYEETTDEGSSAGEAVITARLLREYGPWLYRLGFLLLVAEWLYALGWRRTADVA
jgi:hypothetical protein